MRWNTAPEESMVAKEPATFEELAQCLQDSHDADGAKLLAAFATNRLPGNRERQVFFNTPGALLVEPIVHADAVESGAYPPDSDEFTCLQGDVINTNAAHFESSQIENGSYVIASCTCDMVPGRRDYAMLFRLFPVTKDDPAAKSRLPQLLKFASTKEMYLPPTALDIRNRTGAVANVVRLDGVAIIRTQDLRLATRVASMTLVAWRMYGSLARGLVARAGDDEIKQRASLTPPNGKAHYRHTTSERRRR